jgi:predicted flavoprotein YhiN
MAAEKLAEAGYRVTVYDRMANPGRKFLLAGRGGLNLTHTDEPDEFMARYREASSWLWPYIEEFSPDDLRDWCEGLGEDRFAGSSRLDQSTRKDIS